MQTHLSEGIILNAFNFRDFDQIVTVFTENEGVVKFIAKRGNAFKQNLKALPLTKAEFIYTIGKSELYVLKEISPKDHYLNLRQNLTCLNTACECLKAILDTQLPHKPAPILYKLLLAYLTKIPNFSNHETLTASFYLKILYHEGILDLNATHFFSENELALIYQMASENSFNHLQTILISKDLSLKIKVFFKDSVS